MTGPDPTLPMPGMPTDGPDRTQLSPGTAPGGAPAGAPDRTEPQARPTRPTPRNEATDTSDRTQVLPQIPDVILDRELGRGGMGIVYYGRQPYLDREVAVKLLTETLRGTEYATRFQREARILAGINHPHIVACYQAGLTTAGDCYLVMEYVNGPNLRMWVEEKGPLSPTEAVTLCRDLAQALGHANDKGIIHRDVKPENVLLMRDQRAPSGASFPWVAKLADLGLARREASEESIHLTAQGAVMGTPATMAPEQFEDPDHVDFRADMYGLGCILFHVLTSKPAFARGTMASIFKEKSAGKTPDPRREREDLPAPVSRLTKRLLERKREDRYGSYAALVAECERVLAELQPVPGPAPKRRGPWIAAAVAGVVLVAGGAWWLANGRTGTGSRPVDTQPRPQSRWQTLSAWPRPDYLGDGLFPGRGLARIAAWDKLSDTKFNPGPDQEDHENTTAIFCRAGEGGHKRALPAGPWKLRGMLELRDDAKFRFPRHARVRVELAGGVGLTLTFAGHDGKPQASAQWHRIEAGEAKETTEGPVLEVAEPRSALHFELQRTAERLTLRFAPGNQGADGVQLEIAAPPGAAATLVITASEGRAGFRDFVLTP